MNERNKKERKKQKGNRKLIDEVSDGSQKGGVKKKEQTHTNYNISKIKIFISVSEEIYSDKK